MMLLSDLRKNPLFRKALATANKIPRALERIKAGENSYIERPPIICNSVPKSGTHLLLQIAGALPNTRYYGTFIATMPSLTFNRRRPRDLVGRLYDLAPGEVAGAHLFFDDSVATAIHNRNIVSFFVYRDPRDVVVSEAIYLAKMNRWHRMHRYFARSHTLEEQILLAINGAGKDCPYEYPDIGVRYSEYEGWLEHNDTFCMRFEDLRGEELEAKIALMAKFHTAHSSSGTAGSMSTLVRRAQMAINPEKSHTYRESKVGSWSKVFTDEHKIAFKQVAGDLLIRLGYEKSLDW